MNYDLALNCHRCGEFTEPHRKRDDPKTVMRCGGCGKKHSEDSVFFIDLDRTYERAEDGTLLEEPP